jgi:oligopeptidase B
MFDLTPTPPSAARRPHTAVVHGDNRTDEYHWLREKENPEVLAHIEAENAYADAVMKPTEPLQQALYDEMLARIQETDLSVPYKRGDFLYYSRTEEGKQYPIHCRTRDALDADEEITLDLNALAEGQSFLGLGAYAVSDDGNLLAYATDVTGFRVYTLYIKHLRTGELLPETVEDIGGVVWATDNQTLFYTVKDATKRPYRLFRHALGAPVGDDALVYEEPDALYNAFVYRSRDRKYVFFGSEAHTATEARFVPADDPHAEGPLIRPREADHEYYADHRDGLLYIRTNKNAVNFRLVTAPVSDPSAWTELIAHRPAVMLEDHDLFARHLVLTEREGGLQRLRIRNLQSGEDHDVSFPEPTYGLSGETNAEFDTDLFRFRYTSLITPPSVFDYDMNTRERTLLKETPVLGPYDRTEYVSEFVHATAPDGVKVPISLVYRKDTPRDGSAPLQLYGYGSYGHPIAASFSSSRLSLLERGFVYAIAHIRGGGELGKPWHDDGKMMKKTNTFTDFIACAEFLIAEKYTSPDRLAVRGGSAGGLLMGAVANLRPDLFAVVESHVPFVDVVNTMLDDTLPLTVGEYVEWGNPQEEPAYRYMLSYSPYDNLEPKTYPTMLVKTGLHDSQVMYWEPAKYVARLRTLRTDKNPLVFHINTTAGHGGASGRYDALKELAYDYAFVLTALGVEK